MQEPSDSRMTCPQNCPVIPRALFATVKNNRFRYKQPGAFKSVIFHTRLHGGLPVFTVVQAGVEHWFFSTPLHTKGGSGVDAESTHILEPGTLTMPDALWVGRSQFRR